MTTHDLAKYELFVEETDRSYVWQFEDIEDDSNIAIVRPILSQIHGKWWLLNSQTNRHMNAYAKVRRVEINVNFTES